MLLYVDRPPPPPPTPDDVAADEDKLPMSFDIFLNHSGPNLIESLILIVINTLYFPSVLCISLLLIFTYSAHANNSLYVHENVCVGSN